MIRHLDELLTKTKVIQAVNQIDNSPFIQRKALVNYCKTYDIIIESWSLPLGLQSEQIIVPKSVHKERIRENADIFDFKIADEDMFAINAMDENCSIMPASCEQETSEK